VEKLKESMKLREKTDEQLIAEAFAIFNGGKGFGSLVLQFKPLHLLQKKYNSIYFFHKKLEDHGLWRYKSKTLATL
jgi:hypothetical protein